MAKNMDDTRKEVEGLTKIADGAVKESGLNNSSDSPSRILSALILARSFDNLADAIREAAKEIADKLPDVL